MSPDLARLLAGERHAATRGVERAPDAAPADVWDEDEAEPVSAGPDSVLAPPASAEVPGAGAADVSPGADPETETPPECVAAAGPAPRFRGDDVSLRLDGGWPLRFRGALLCETARRVPAGPDRPQGASDPDVPDRAIVTRLGLWLTEDGRVLAQVSSEPGPGLPARPVHRAGEVSGPQDVIRLLDTAGAAACFAVSPRGLVEFGPGRAEVRPDFPGLEPAQRQSNPEDLAI